MLCLMILKIISSIESKENSDNYIEKATDTN